MWWGRSKRLQACAKNMAANGGGAIVQTGSVAGLRGTPTMGAYVASKAAIHGLTMTAAKDLAPHSIRVNTVMPALIGPSSGFMWQRRPWNVRLLTSRGSSCRRGHPDPIAAP